MTESYRKIDFLGLAGRSDMGRILKGQICLPSGVNGRNLRRVKKDVVAIFLDLDTDDGHHRFSFWIERKERGSM